jgi:hypothetical protein
VNGGGPLLFVGGENANSGGAVADSEVKEEASELISFFEAMPKPELDPQSEDRLLGGVDEGEESIVGSPPKPTTFWEPNAKREGGCCWNVVVLMFFVVVSLKKKGELVEEENLQLNP